MHMDLRQDWGWRDSLSGLGWRDGSQTGLGWRDEKEVNSNCNKSRERNVSLKLSKKTAAAKSWSCEPEEGRTDEVRSVT